MFLNNQVLLGLLHQFLTEIVCSLNVSFTLLALREWFWSILIMNKKYYFTTSLCLMPPNSLPVFLLRREIPKLYQKLEEQIISETRH